MKNLILIPCPLAFKSPQEGWRGGGGGAMEKLTVEKTKYGRRYYFFNGSDTCKEVVEMEFKKRQNLKFFAYYFLKVHLLYIILHRRK